MRLPKYKVIFRYKNITLWRYNKVLTGKLTSRKWLDLNNIEDYPLLPVAVKEILREGKFPVHWINDDLKA